MGSSVAAPVWAGIVNSAGNFSAASPAELTTVYASEWNGPDLADIVRGSPGPNEGYLVETGWNPVSASAVRSGKEGSSARPNSLSLAVVPLRSGRERAG